MKKIKLFLGVFFFAFFFLTFPTIVRGQCNITFSPLPNEVRIGQNIEVKVTGLTNNESCGTDTRRYALVTNDSMNFASCSICSPFTGGVKNGEYTWKNVEVKNNVTIFSVYELFSVNGVCEIKNPREQLRCQKTFTIQSPIPTGASGPCNLIISGTDNLTIQGSLPPIEQGKNLIWTIKNGNNEIRRNCPPNTDLFPINIGQLGNGVYQFSLNLRLSIPTCTQDKTVVCSGSISVNNQQAQITETKPSSSFNSTDLCQGDSNCIGCFVDEDGTWTALGCIPTGDLNKFASWIVGKFVFIASGIAFLLMAFGAFQIITSSGDPKKAQAGSEVITSALSGLLFIILSIFLLKLIGVDILRIPGFGS